MAEIGSAFVTLLPSARGFGKATEKQIGGELDKSGSSLGSRLMGGMGKTMKVGALAAGGAVAGIMGTALVKGFSRLQGIDQAEAKLRGLGHSAKGVDAIMTNALNSVKGTAFGLDAAATTAAGAVAAGVKPGQQLERTLGLVGDAATIAGTDMDEMGAIFNKVASSDMIQGDVLAQLGDQGIPILQLLGKEMGVSATEVRKLASQGKIDFATFQNAMEAGLGGAALESGSTFSGSLANMQAALGRLGAAVLGGVFEKMPNLFTNITGALDSLSPVATRVGEALGTAFARIGPLLSSLASRLKPVFDQVKGFFAGEGGSAVTGFIDTIKANVVPVLQTMAATFTQTILPAVTSFVSYVAAALMPIFKQVWEIISTQVVPIIASLAQFLYGTLYPALVSIVTAVAKNLKPVFDALVQTFQDHLLPAISKILERFRKWLPTIQKVIGVVVKVVAVVLRFAAAILGKVLPPVIRFAGFLIGKVVSAVLAVIGVIGKIIGWLVKFGTGVFNAGKKVVNFANNVRQRINAVIELFLGLKDKAIGALSGAAKWLVQVGRDIVSGLIKGFEEASKWLMDKIRSLGDKIPGWLKRRLGIASPSRVMAVLGRDIGAGLVVGMDDSVKPIQAAFGRMTSGLTAPALDVGFGGVMDVGGRLDVGEALSARLDRSNALLEQVRDGLALVGADVGRQINHAAARGHRDLVSSGGRA